MKDDFNLDNFENKKEEEITNKEKFNNVLAYIPFLNIWLLFNETHTTKKEDKKYIRQWITIFLLYIVVFFIFSILSFKVSFLLTAIYFWLVIFFAAKAYNWIYVEIVFIEKIMAQFEPKKDKLSKNLSEDDKKI